MKTSYLTEEDIVETEEDIVETEEYFQQGSSNKQQANGKFRRNNISTVQKHRFRRTYTHTG